MIMLAPVTLEGHGVRLEPLGAAHEAALRIAVADGRLWDLWYSTVPEPDDVGAYIARALQGQRAGHMLPFAVRDLTRDAVVGSTRYHDVEPSIDRVHIGYTWYARSSQRTHVNTAAKLLLMTHAFEVVGARVIVLRTDRFNLASQRAIAALGARQDGVLRHHQARKDGTVRDTVMFSILATEWPEVKRHLLSRLARHARDEE
jgi:RimJ/RimL family protein N-acetyltransferase